jgi:hypothetical protein
VAQLVKMTPRVPDEWRQPGGARPSRCPTSFPALGAKLIRLSCGSLICGVTAMANTAQFCLFERKSIRQIVVLGAISEDGRLLYKNSTLFSRLIY